MSESKDYPVIQTGQLAEGLRRAREFRGLTFKETCQTLGIPTNKLQNYELGKYIPSLPELEALALIYGVPFEALTQPDDYPDLYKTPEEGPIQQLLAVRRKVIATHLQIAFEKSGKTYKELENASGAGTSRIKRYLEGKEDIPVDILMKFEAIFSIPDDMLRDRDSVVGKWLNYKERAHRFTKLTDENQALLSKPEAKRIFEAAERISKMDPDKLADLGDALKQAAEISRNTTDSAD